MSPEQDEAPSLPSYPPPQTGLTVADPRQSKPLYKLMKSLIKPKPRVRTAKHAKWKSKYPYY